ncbi:hypothetical protein BDP55DRAFT_656000 [Colletotrichum godetiae]|uniref:Uncharacterized protein n=1 Tax=Colletotrichum godetiae TaxID=1209918 RepID=A0AAJ0AQF0_9PEZI|nr:uncharacterized protein BDP55DRAFT_656000 [Colletotrichum godetiae]KAK1688469.1 hypothetical protein BDP55DRAFT_656000 [Colletotrichum godetiae]
MCVCVYIVSGGICSFVEGFLEFWFCLSGNPNSERLQVVAVVLVIPCSVHVYIVAEGNMRPSEGGEESQNDGLVGIEFVAAGGEADLLLLLS